MSNKYIQTTDQKNPENLPDTTGQGGKVLARNAGNTDWEFVEQGGSSDPTYTPVNFTPTGGDIDGYLEGIDNELAPGATVVENVGRQLLDTTYNPIGLWHFDGDGADSSGNGRDLSFTTTAVYSPSLLPNVRAFDNAAENNEATIADSAFALTGAMTFQAVIWINTVDGSNQTIASYNNAGAPDVEANNALWTLYYNSSSGFNYFHESSPATDRNLPTNVIPLAGEWMHVAFTKAANGTDIELFVNGTSVFAGSVTAAATGGANSILRIGSSETSDRFHGRISSVKINDSVLTDTQIALEAQRALNVGSVTASSSYLIAQDSDDVIRWFGPGSISGDTVTNQGSTGGIDDLTTNNGTSHNDPSPPDADTFKVKGNVDGARTQTMHYETATSPTNPDVSNGLTISGWLYYEGGIANLDRICLKQNSTAWSGSPLYTYGFLAENGPASTLIFNINAGGTATALSAPNTFVSDNERTWIHIGATIDAGGSTVRLYVNGVEADNTALVAAPVYGTGPWVLGNRVGASANRFPGTFLDWRVAETERDANWFESAYTRGIDFIQESSAALRAPNDSENGGVALAVNGDVSYLQGTGDGYVLAWNETDQAWESQNQSNDSTIDTITIVSTTQTTQQTGFTVLSAFEFDPADFNNPTSVDFRALIETDNAADGAEIRLLNITTASEVTGSVLSTTNTTTTLVNADLVANMASGSNIYEVQLRLQTTGAPNTASCKRAELRVS